MSMTIFDINFFLVLEIGGKRLRNEDFSIIKLIS